MRRSILRRLDYLPAWLAITLGVGVGALAGGLLMRAYFLSGAMLVVLFLTLLALAAGLAFGGEPIGVLEAVAIEPPPPAVPHAMRPVWIALPGGSFLMGSPEDEEGRFDREGPVHEVRVSSFEIMQVPVTRQLYAEVMGEDPGWPEGDADQRPINKVSWWDAMEYCNRLSEREGLATCYRRKGDAVDWHRSADGFRLPTEAEWEYACRAGTRTRRSFGNDDSELERFGWFSANSGGQPQQVGHKEPNPWGLHDMHGNVYEWCWDRFGAYPGEPQIDPTGPDDGSFRVLRGGAFFYSPWDLRSAYRGGFRPGNRDVGIGFRCARSPRRQP